MRLIITNASTEYSGIVLLGLENYYPSGLSDFVWSSDVGMRIVNNSDPIYGTQNITIKPNGLSIFTTVQLRLSLQGC